MRHLQRPLVLIVFLGFLISGCATHQGALPKESAAPEDSIGGPTEGQDIVVEAQGVSFIGDKDTIEAARIRAKNDALKKAVEKGALTFISSYSSTDFGKLSQDQVKSVMAATLTSIETVEERLTEDNRFIVKIRARVSPVKVKEMLAKMEKGPGVEAVTAQPQDKGESVVVSEKRMPLVSVPQNSQLRSCFNGFPEEDIAKFHSVLTGLPNIISVERLGNVCRKKGCICYRLLFSRQVAPEELTAWLRPRLMHDGGIIPFKAQYGDDGYSVTLFFDAGFE